ncbi:hypothetical protein C0Q70_04229 [Pomacea canaliculata]|uniref:Acyltransferase 3 domain-containing protein n=1 Tax=Pomacea canaliculata TaxID=400727 RepID=A0A2T7PUX7_POMCA|nr:hypothetical protein C0Q70_04229 [Pomacea canaliculata]
MCLHGLRTLSICWVVVENGLTAAEALETVLGQVVINSTLAVDTFFVLSGCLTAYLSLLTVRQDEGVSAKRVGQFYLHRYLRITPTYGIFIMFCTCLLPYFSGGPDWWRKSTEYYSSCRSYWWTNILYINNFYRSHDDQCVPWSWYLSADMQLYWLAPILLLFLAAGFRIVGGLLICGVVVMHSALTAYLEQSVNGDFLRNADDFSWNVFQKTYCRCAPYVLGLGVGYILTRVKGFYTMSRATRIIGWICTLALTSTTTFIKYDENSIMLDHPFYWSEQSRAVHEALFRTGFSLAVCWIIFACATGNGGFINSILSWRGFLPLSRLSFCVYLLHPMIMLADMWTSRIPVFFTISYVVRQHPGDVRQSSCSSRDLAHV